MFFNVFIAQIMAALIATSLRLLDLGQVAAKIFFMVVIQMLVLIFVLEMMRVFS